eukprot:TRINITY_DN34935_c0_g1_i1.p1 TRINITY_DN34935_c0_g1~~TRINITY_DN34935_c0_g1_i1.p1  ORF type:complete len:382 (+),score=66.30 TRINITY_DN34935_c0_g1_i1:25-1146(+)
MAASGSFCCAVEQWIAWCSGASCRPTQNPETLTDCLVEDSLTDKQQRCCKQQEEVGSGLLQERTAMIVGMNPKMLRRRLPWQMYLWRKGRHWALVIRPFGEQFVARVVDDFVYNAQFCFSSEISSSRLCLVYELLVDQDDLFYLMLSAKPDFCSARSNVQPLGVTLPLSLLDVQAHALTVIMNYKKYSFIGCNCQHFAYDLACNLGASLTVSPEDKAIALAARESAEAVTTVSVAIAGSVSATACTLAGISALTATGTAVGVAPVALALGGVAAGASILGLAGSILLHAAASIYDVLHAGSRQRISTKVLVRLPLSRVRRQWSQPAITWLSPPTSPSRSKLAISSLPLTPPAVCCGRTEDTECEVEEAGLLRG